MGQQKEINLKSINVQIFLSVFVSLISISVYFIASSYNEAIDNEERNVLKRLHAITSTAALQIDGDQHELMFSTYPNKNGISTIEEDSNYYAIQEILEKVASANNLQSPIYSAVYNPKTKEFLMGVSSDDSVFFRHKYTSYPIEIIEHYKQGGEIPTYEDEYGTWLSAFAPLTDSDENVVAIVQTDVTFDDFISSAREKLMRNIVFSILVLIIVGLVMLFSLRRILKKDKLAKVELVNSKLLIQEKQEELVESITYALRIQRAILPPDKLIKSTLAKSFVLYKPKDIVSGDFYWLEKVGDTILFAAADCTGHGVPGAMVSVICNGGLNRSVREFGLTDPGEILGKTRELVIQEFEKSEEVVKDGMDIALCALNFQDSQRGNALLSYAGANSPLWVVRNGELIETKANKQPIGQYAEVKPFTTHTIELLAGDLIYLMSDGYQDQFGGSKGKKFKPKNLKNLILSVQELSMEEQKVKLEQAFEEWKGDLEQLDDVSVIGVRL